MKLNKRYARSLRHNLSFYIAASLLTAMAAFLLVSMYTAVFMIDVGFSGILQAGNVEHAQFSTLAALDGAAIKAIEEKFNVELEQVQTVDLSENAYTLRIFAPTTKINRYQILEGSDIAADSEILLNRDFALAHAIAPGDSLLVGGRTYTVAGYAARPDYLYAQMDNNDFYVDKAIFGQVTMNRAAFARLPDTQSYYVIVYHGDNNVEVRRYLNEKYGLLRYLAAESNNRINIVHNFADEYGIMLGSFIPLLFAMITVIVAVVIGRVVRREQRQIGTLVALGYRRRELVRHYAVYAAIPGICGSVPGIALAVLFLRPVSLIFATDFETINFTPRLYGASVVIALVVPVWLYIMTAVLAVRHLLRQKTVQLLYGSGNDARQQGRRILVRSNLPFGWKYRLRALLSHKSRALVVIMGMFVGTFLCAFGLIMIDTSNALIDKGLDAAGSYEYQYFLSTVKTGSPPAGEPALCFDFEVPGFERQFILSGIVENPEYLTLAAKSGASVEYGQYYLTTNAAALYGIAAGDSFTFINPFTTSQHTVKIAAILDDNTQCILYSSLANVSALLGLPDTSYNVIMSDQKIALDDAIVAYTNTKENMKKQLRYSINLIMVFVYLMLAFGSVLCIITVYLTVNMFVEENRHNISMLKVLGYRKREINRLVLNVNHVLLPVSFVLSIWACIKLCEKMFEEFIAVLNIYFDPTITAASMLLCAAVLVASYAGSLALLKRKVYRINMVESLKDNRE